MVSRTSPVLRSHDPSRRGDGRVLKVSPGRLGEDHLVERQIRYRPTEPGVLRLKLHQLLNLMPFEAAVLLTPAVICNFRHSLSTGWLPRPDGPVPSAHRPAAASRQSLRPCVSSLAFSRPPSGRKAINQGGPLQRGQTRRIKRETAQAARYPSQPDHQWKAQLLDGAARERTASATPPVDVKDTACQDR